MRHGHGISMTRSRRRHPITRAGAHDMGLSAESVKKLLDMGEE